MKTKHLRENIEALSRLYELVEFSQTITIPCYRNLLSINGKSYIVPLKEKDQYDLLMRSLYASDNFLVKNFSYKTISSFVEEKIINIKKNNIQITNNFANSFFDKLKNITPETKRVYTPISGIRITQGNSFKLGIYEFCLSNKFKIPITNDLCTCIGVTLDNIYDNQYALNVSENLFIDFGRLIHFLLGRFDNEHIIKIGLPIYPMISHDKMYVNTSSSIILNINDCFDHSSISNRYLEVIPIDNNFFTAHPQFNKIWELQEESIKSSQSLSKNEIKQFNKKLSTRIINSAIAIGASAESDDIKSSMIYACIGLETLLSYDDNSSITYDNNLWDRLKSSIKYIFTTQKNKIGVTEKMAVGMATILAKNKDGFNEIYKIIKKLYGMRSALVHGGQKIIVKNDAIQLGTMVRAAIAKLLNDERFKHIESIGELWDLIKNIRIN